MMKKYQKHISILLLVIFLNEVIFPTAALALTGGPSQPEVQSFEPISTTQMVDPFTGDFTYNIPLLDIEGYPINISYHSGVSMDQEASWVGLGWNLNPGALTRSMRGLPDDFNGDEITRETYFKPDQTFNVGFGYSKELFGWDLKKNWNSKKNKIDTTYGSKLSLTVGLGIRYNNYKGIASDVSIGTFFNSNKTLNSPAAKKMGLGLSGSVGLSLSNSSDEGLTTTKEFGLSARISKLDKDKNEMGGFSMGMNTSTQTNSTSGTKISHRISANYSSRNFLTETKHRTSYQSDGGHRYNVGIGVSYNSIVGHPYSPKIDHNMSNYNVSLSFKYGKETAGLSTDYEFKGGYAGQFLESRGTPVTAKSYGYYYAQNADDGSLMDFNREKDGAFTIHNPNIPLPIITNDLFSYSGQGTGGMFRTYRSDLGTFSDKNQESGGVGGHIGFGMSAGQTFKGALDLSFNWSNSTSGVWQHKMWQNFRFTQLDESDPLMEPAYFKAIGEKNLVDNQFFPYKDLVNPIAFRLDRHGKHINVNQNLFSIQYANSGEGRVYAKSNLRRTRRDKRNIYIGPLTVSQKYFCLEPTITSSYNGSTTTILRDAGYRKTHHFTQVSVQNPDGNRYVYGIPAYVSTQVDYSFTNARQPKSNTAPVVDCATGHVEYEHDKLGSQDRNFCGIDKYFDKSTTPAYTHSFLLTAVLSPDYVDNDGTTGPSEGDYGNYTKIGYTKINYSGATDNNYRWRVPYLENKATYNRGLYNDDFDDNAGIIYGEKEIWHMTTIEGRNMIARFYISPRNDGYGVKGVHGGLDTDQPSYKLDSIKLFSKSDPDNPIKSVYFVYDYSLCKGVHNNSSYDPEDPDKANSGKLTLKSVYFTYGSTCKGKYNAYKFNYGFNPSYNLKGYDRWGNYKPNTVSDCFDATTPSTSEFPYVDQNKTTADEYASAWSLNEILLPSGGKINIEYESDDYAYIQDKTAMQMYKLLGAGYSSTSNPTETLINGSGFFTTNNYLFIDLPNQDINNAYFRNAVMAQGNDLSYNLMMNLSSDQFDVVNLRKYKSEVYEPIKGYCKFNDAGVVYNASLGRNIGWIKLNEVKATDESDLIYTNPISKASWQYARMNLPYLLNPGANLMRNDEGALSNTVSVLKTIAGFIPAILTNKIDPNIKLMTAGFASKFNKNKSWIRLSNLTGFKYGGGCRVKQIALSDEWNSMEPTGNATAKTYGQQFSYTTTESFGGEEMIISSGVASYEPMIGAEENPFRQPIYYSESNKDIPDDDFFAELPFGESLFPSPVVGYSKVSVKSLEPSLSENVAANKTGKIVHEFYTSRDFPTLVKVTNVQSEPVRPNWIWSLIMTKVEDRLTVSQGYLIHLNDMHGKPKAVFNYAADRVDQDDPKYAYSGMKYEYFTDPETKTLKNEVQVISPENVITTGVVGVDVDMYSDSRRNLFDSKGGGMQGNLDVFALGPIPIPVPTALPQINNEITDFKSVTLVKVIQSYGIQKSTTAFENGASLSTENILFDAETGEVLLTKTQNEFEDNIYNATYPAHWVYDNMGGAYKNALATFTLKPYPYSLSDKNSFKIHIGSVDYYPDQFLVNGDLVSLDNIKYWVFKKLDGNFCLMNSSGEYHDFATSANVQIQVIESGRKNLQTLPVAQVSSLKSPISGTSLVHNTATEVIQASAVEYKDNWPVLSCYQSYTSYKYFNDEAIDIFKYLIKTGQILMNQVVSDTLAGKENLQYCPQCVTDTMDQYAMSDSTYLKSTYRKYLDSTGLDKSYFRRNVGYTIQYDNPDTALVMVSYSLKPDDGTYYKSLGQAELARLQNYVSFFFMADTARVNALKAKSMKRLDFTGPYSLSGVNYGYLVFNDDDSVQVQISSLSYVQLTDFSGNAPVQANPFLINARNNWKPWKTWAYLDNRVSQNDSLHTNIRKDGYFKSYTHFWSNSGSGWSTGYPSKWQFTNEITKYHTTGTEAESRNPLDQYSSVLYSPATQLPVAVAQNCKHKHLLSETFEAALDIDHAPYCPIRGVQYFFDTQFKDSTVAHTGKYSYKADKAIRVRTIASDVTANNGTSEFLLDTADQYGGFSPDPGKYVLSAWVRVDTNSLYSSYSGASIKITYRTASSSATITANASGKIIDGWQRIEKEITFPAGTIYAEIEFVRDPSVSPSINTYFDDVRLHPKEALVKSYVYDKQLKLIAELDENNYATFYEYDEEGNLARIKKETERGIITLKEVRSSFKKRN